MGKLIVIDGLDGSGKHTQTLLLQERLEREGIDCRMIQFPTYGKSSALIEMYLDGELSASADGVNAYAASSFYAVDRVASYLGDWKKDYDGGKVILCDRYTTSNAIHQLSKVPPRDRDAYLTWLREFEYEKLGLPRPSAVVFLKMPLDVSRALITERYCGDESRRDLHEKDMAYLEKCFEAAQYAGEKLGFLNVDCTENGKLLTREAIAEKIWRLVKKEIV